MRPGVVRSGVVVLVSVGVLMFAGTAEGSVGVVGSFGSAFPGMLGGEFDGPAGVAVNDASGDVYVADSVNDRIEELSSAGVFVRAWGGEGTGAGKLSDPQGVAVNQSSGDVYVSDEGNLRVDEFDKNGGFIRAWGAGVIASGPDQVPVNEQQSVSIGGTGGTFKLTFVTSSPSVSATTVPVAFDAPSVGVGSVQKALEGLANVGAGSVGVSGPAGGPYVVTFKGALADTNVSQLTVDGSGLSGPAAGATVATVVEGAGAPEVCGEGDTCQGGLSGSVGGAFASVFDGYLAVVPVGAPGAGDVVVADPGNSRVQEFTSTGVFVRAIGRGVDRWEVEEPGSSMAQQDVCTAVSGDLCQAGTAGSGVGQFGAGEPTRVAVDGAGAIYTVESSANYRVQKLAPAGGGGLVASSVFAGSVLTGSEQDDAPSDVAVDPVSGEVYVLKAHPGESEPYDPAESLLLRLSPTGVLQETGMVGDGIASVDGLAIDPSNGRSYVSSTMFGQRVYVVEEVPAPSGPPYAECPNEALRDESDVNPSTGNPVASELPDCRAYEQVTPNYKDGFKISEGSISEDGSLLVGTSLGTFADSEDNPLGSTGATYQFARSGSGWATTALDAPASQWASQTYVDTAPDGSSVWLLRPFSEPLIRQRYIYVRAPDGALSEVGPVLPPGAPEQGSTPGSTNVLAESRDLSHIFFAGQQGPAEYTGRDNTEPELVGVSGGHGSRALVSQCGTGLGGVAVSGETVFFTAGHEVGCGGIQPPVDEVYARVSREKTLAISEAVLPPGESCTGVCMEDRSETGGHHRSPGVFDGASEDGTKVFFETAQPLLSGDEDEGNDLYMAEIQGTGQDAAISRLVQVSHDPHGKPAEVQGVARISEDGSRVYFVAKGVLISEPNGAGRTASLGHDNLYVYDTGTERTAFAATLSPSDSEDWTAGSAPVQATPNGGFLVFSSRADLTGGAPYGTPQIYRYDAATGDLARVSIGQGDFHEKEVAEGEMELPGSKESLHLATAGRGVSDDGSRVFFTSTDGLTPRALNKQTIDDEGHEALNVYEWEADHSGGCELYTGCVWLITDGHDVSEEEGGRLVELLGTDASGDDVFFSTSDELAPSDTNSDVDVYDARVDGGFPAPSEPASCAGAQCQPEESPKVASQPGAATSSFAGPGDLVSTLITTTSTTTMQAPSSSKAKTAAQLRSEEFAKALRGCRSKPRARRKGCETLARKRYAPQNKAKKSNRKARR